MTPPAPSGPSLLRRASMSAGVTLGLLGVVELGMGLAGTADSALYQGDPGYYWTLRTELDLPRVDHVEEGTTFSVRTSGAGLRDGALPSDGTWVLALGCSTTFGWGVEAEQSWPEQLEARLGVDVVNAGMPGHSSHQGRTFAPPLLARQPTLAILGWGIRDAQMAPKPDAEARPATFPRTTHLYRWLRDLLPRSPSPAMVPRVGAEAFGANVRAIADAARAAGAKVLLLDFPSRSPSETHRAALDGLGHPVIRPALPESAFFSTDPIHLTAEGNRRLAESMEASVRSALGLTP